MDQQLFRLACDKAGGETALKGIGTLGEKTLHSVLKNYFEPDETRQEIPIAGFVADIAAENGIIEIQTRAFNALRRKLACFLDLDDVTIVYPVARTKWLIWIDEETGELTKKRKSPKTGTPYQIFPELYKIKSLLTHPRLSLCIVLLELEEYRYLNGWSENRKKGSSRHDRIPVGLTGEVYIRTPEEYLKLIPPQLDGRFTSKEFKAASGLTLPAAQTALNVLSSVGAVARAGKQGNSIVYERAAVQKPKLEAAE